MTDEQIDKLVAAINGLTQAVEKQGSAITEKLDEAFLLPLRNHVAREKRLTARMNRT